MLLKKERKEKTDQSGWRIIIVPQGTNRMLHSILKVKTKREKEKIYHERLSLKDRTLSLTF